MSPQLYVGNLPYEIEKRDLEDIFSGYGVVRRVELKKGFAFVTMKTEEQARAAIKGLHGKEIGGRAMKFGTPSKEW